MIETLNTLKEKGIHEQILFILNKHISLRHVSNFALRSSIPI